MPRRNWLELAFLFSIFCQHSLLNLGCSNWLEKDTQPILWYDWQFNFNLNPESYGTVKVHCLLTNAGEEMSIWLFYIVQINMCDWHQILHVHYFRPYRSIIFDSVHRFLQRYDAAEIVFAPPTLQSPGVLPSCECLGYAIAHQCSFWS